MELAAPGWLILGVPLRCLGVPPEARRELESLLQGFTSLQADPAAGPAGPGTGTVDLALHPEDGREDGPLLLTDGEGERWQVTGGDAPLSSHLEYRLVNEAIRRDREHWILHAGAVVGSAGTCLIVGESGAGKTSLTLWLWAHGLRLVTDDLCPLTRGSLAPETFPRALHMDAEYSPRLIERIPPRPAAYPATYYPFPAAAGDPVPPVTRLLVIERGPDPDGALEPLSQSEAAHRLVQAVIKSPSFDFGQALDDMIALAGRCRSHRLRSSTPEGAGATALRLLAGD
jgi:hypothetical protein